MDVNAVIDILLVVATIAVVWFAWQTVKEARKTTTEERNAVAELQELVTEMQKLVAAAQATEASSASALEAAQETVEVARLAREADHRHHYLEQLRTVSRLVQDILQDAERASVFSATGSASARAWRSPVQQLQQEVRR